MAELTERRGVFGWLWFAGSGQREPVRGQDMVWMVAALTASTIGHVTALPVWLLPACGLLAMWRIRAAYRGATGLPRMRRWTLALLVLGALGLSGSIGLGLATALPCFVAFLWLKLVELEQRQDLVRIGFLTFFLSAAHLMVDGSLLRFGLALLGMLITVAALAQAHEVRRPLRRSLILLTGALPVAGVLFVLMPRAPIGMVQNTQAQSGLSERLDAHNMSAMAKDPAVAFRATSDGPALSMDDLWWRVFSMGRFDGQTWWRHVEWQDRGFVDNGGTGLVRLEILPTRERWLPALEMPLGFREGRRTSDGSITVTTPLRSARSVEYRYDRDERPRDLPTPMHRAMPDPIDNRIIEAGQALARSGTVAQVIRAAERWFAERGFVYSLTPDRAQGESLSAFLFGQSKAGYCAHYAAHGAILLRAAGVPSRVISGYRGGEINRLTGQVVVRKLHAHAWIEAWDGSVWMRLDPTALLPMAPGQDAPAGSAVASESSEPPPPPGVWDQASRPFREAWDAVEGTWISMVIAFDSERQMGWLKALGLGGMGYWGVGLLGLLAVTVVWIIWRRISQSPQPASDPLTKSWLTLRRRLSKAGWPTTAQDDPLACGQRLAHGGDPESAALCMDLAQLRYGQAHTDPQAIRAWQRRAKRHVPRQAPPG